MEGLSRSLGLGGTITLCGQKFRANARILRCYAEAEAEVLSRRGDPAQMLASRASEYQEFNTRPFLDKLAELAERLSKEKEWGEDAKTAVDTLLKIAEKELDETPYFESLMGLAFDEAQKRSGASIGDLDDFLKNTWLGQRMRLWFAIRDTGDRRLTLEDVSDMFADEVEDRMRPKFEGDTGGSERVAEFYKSIEDAISQAEGSDNLGNSNGSSSNSSQKKETETGESTGTSSLETSSSP